MKDLAILAAVLVPIMLAVVILKVVDAVRNDLSPPAQSRMVLALGAVVVVGCIVAAARSGGTGNDPATTDVTLYQNDPGGRFDEVNSTAACADAWLELAPSDREVWATQEDFMQSCTSELLEAVVADGAGAP